MLSIAHIYIDGRCEWKEIYHVNELIPHGDNGIKTFKKWELMIKSKAISLHGLSRIDKGCTNLYAQYRGQFDQQYA